MTQIKPPPKKSGRFTSLSDIDPLQTLENKVRLVLLLTIILGHYLMQKWLKIRSKLYQTILTRDRT